MLEDTLISIEMIDGVKHIHYLGFGFYNGEPKERPYRWVNYTGLIFPLKEVLEYGLSKWEEDNQELVIQYIVDLSAEEVEHIFDETYYYDILEENEIDENINCGTYWYVAD